MATVSDKGF